MFNKLKSINIYITDDKVGTLALTSENLCVFEYDADWIKKGYSISPFYLPLKKKFL
jgi:serine/threonine-protein kinase HipA